MRLKMIVVDLELTRRQRCFGGLGLVAAVVLATSAAFAAPTAFVAGSTLKAADLNANFAELHARLTTLEAEPTYLVSTSSVAQTGPGSGDLVYDHVEVELTPGTWFVEGSGTLHTNIEDAVQLALWDQTNLVEVPASRGPASLSVRRSESGCAPNQCMPAPGSASSVITVTTATKIRIKAIRLSGTAVTLGAADGLALAPLNRIWAVRLR